MLQVAEYCYFPRKMHILNSLYVIYTGGLVMALEEEGFTNGEVLVEEVGVIALGRGLVSAMEEDDCLG